MFYILNFYLNIENKKNEVRNFTIADVELSTVEPWKIKLKEKSIRDDRWKRLQVKET